MCIQCNARIGFCIKKAGSKGNGFVIKDFIRLYLECGNRIISEECIQQSNSDHQDKKCYG